MEERSGLRETMKHEDFEWFARGSGLVCHYAKTEESEDIVGSYVLGKTPWHIEACGVRPALLGMQYSLPWNVSSAMLGLQFQAYNY